MKGLRFALAALLAALPGLAPAAPSLEWTATYDGGGLYVDEARLALTDPAGNLVIAGTSHDGVDGLDLLAMKLAKDTGAVLWERRQPSFDGNDMAVSALSWDGLGDLLLVGYVVGCVG
jgi:hypothetical protein